MLYQWAESALFRSNIDKGGGDLRVSSPAFFSTRCDNTDRLSKVTVAR